MEEALTSMLLGHGPLQALVGDRINWLVRKQNSGAPYVILQVISAAGGAAYRRPDALHSARVQVDCWAATLRGAKAVAAAVRQRIEGHRGIVGATVFDGIFLDAERHGYSAPDTPDKLFRVSMDFLIWHKGV